MQALHEEIFHIWHEGDSHYWALNNNLGWKSKWQYPICFLWMKDISASLKIIFKNKGNEWSHLRLAELDKILVGRAWWKAPNVQICLAQLLATTVVAAVVAAVCARTGRSHRVGSWCIGLLKLKTLQTYEKTRQYLLFNYIYLIYMKCTCWKTCYLYIGSAFSRSYTVDCWN